MKLQTLFLLALCLTLLLVPVSVTTVPVFDQAFAQDEGDGTEDPEPEKFQEIELLEPFDKNQQTISVKDKDAIGILGAYVSQIFTFGMALIVIFAILMIMVAGYEYMLAGGDSSKTDNAKSRMAQAAFGLILVFLSAVLLNIINPNFYKL